MLRYNYKAADARLQQAIDTVQQNLASAVTELNGSIAENRADIEVELADVDAAYRAADALLQSDMVALREQDGNLAAEIRALESAYKAADDAIWAGIRQAQENLTALQQRLEEKDTGLETKLNGMLADNEKTAWIYIIVNTVLGAAAGVLLVTLMIKGIRKKNW